MKTLTTLLVLAVCSNAEINLLFFSGASIYIDCPEEGTFYQWKKYYLNQKINLLSDDKRRLNVPLNSDFSPVTYECSGTNGFINYNENITIFVLDQQSTQARKQCFIKKDASNPTAEYPCFLFDQNHTTIYGFKGTAVDLNCEAGGINVTYVWYKLNTPHSHKEQLHMLTNVPVMKIQKFNEKLAGQYLCIVNSTSGAFLKRYFYLQVSKTKSLNVISISGPIFANITVKLKWNHNLTCQARSSEANSIHLIQWAKKVNSEATENDKTVIKWGDISYRLIPETRVQNNRQSENSVTSSLVLNSVTSENAGEYICAFFTNEGKMTHKTFTLHVEAMLNSDVSERSFLFLYILIPSFIIAVCIFAGIYLAINRITLRKASSSGTGTIATNSCKSDKETIRLRNTPDYSIKSYTSQPPTTQYLINNNYPNQYYPTSDKSMV